MQQGDFCLPCTVPSTLVTPPFLICCLLLLRYPLRLPGSSMKLLYSRKPSRIAQRSLPGSVWTVDTFLSLFPSPRRDAKEGDCDAPGSNPKTRESEPFSQGASLNDQHPASYQPFSHHPEFFMDALLSLSFLCILLLAPGSPNFKQ